MGRQRILAFGSILVFVITLNSAESPAPAPAPEARPIALVGGMIRTQSDLGDFVGTIVVRDGKIAALGANVAAPADALVIDASKFVITPGLIDANGMLGVHAGAARESGSAAGLDIIDAVDPFADDWRDAARQGVTAVYAQPNGSLGGSGAVLRVGPGPNAPAIAVKSPAAIQAALGQAPTAQAPAANPQLAEAMARFGIAPPPQPAGPPPSSNSLTRFAQAEQLKSQLDGARRYGESKTARRDAAKALLLKAIKKEIPIRLEVHHEDDIRNALKIGNDFGLRIVWEHIERAAVIPEDFAAAKAGIVLGPILGGKLTDAVRKVALDGRKIAIGTFGDEPRATAGLRLHAAAAVAAGMPRDAVLKALTSDAAELLGVSDKFGRLSVGRVADLVAVAGDPLDPSAPVRLTISQGVVTHNDAKIEPAPQPIAATPSLPEQLPPRFVLKTNRLMNFAGDFAPGELVIESGKISERVPSGIEIPTFDLGEAPVTPGLVAGHVGFESETSPDADAAHLRAADGLAFSDRRIRGYRDAGFLTAVIAPGSTNVIAGGAAAVPTYEPGRSTDVGLKFVLTPSARSRDRFPASLAGQFEFIDQRLRGEPSETNLFLPLAVQTTLLAERERPMTAVRDKKLTAWFEASNRAEIRDALRLISEHKLKAVLLMPRNVEELTDEIRAAGVAVVVGRQRPNDSELTTRGMVALGQANVPMAFGGDVNDLRVGAAWLVNAGLPRPVARRALTGQPATAFGLPPKTGQLIPGESADLVVWDGDPIDTASKPVAVVAQGQRVVAGPDDDEPKKRTATPGQQPAPTRRGRR
jgi:imidazolonepropionase-like amidohydrolase